MMTLIPSMEFLIFVWLPMAIVLVLILRYIARLMRRMSSDLDQFTQYISLMRRRGIYAIVCRRTNAAYYGSTTINFHSRWGQHIAKLERGTHENPRLQQDWNTYGAEAFEFLIVEAMDEPAIIIRRREEQILKYRAMHVVPAQNYNVNHSRVYPVPAAPEHGQA